MTFTEYFDAIRNTTRDDYSVVHTPTGLQRLTQAQQGDQRWIEIEGHHIIATLMSDLRISIAYGLPHLEDFREQWANMHPDPSASSTWIHFLYNGSPIYASIGVWVDGGRALLPVPNRDSHDATTGISTFSFGTGQLDVYRPINGFEADLDMDSYVQRTGAIVVQRAWPDVR